MPSKCFSLAGFGTDQQGWMRLFLSVARLAQTGYYLIKYKMQAGTPVQKPGFFYAEYIIVGHSIAVPLPM